MTNLPRNIETAQDVQNLVNAIHSAISTRDVASNQITLDLDFRAFADPQIYLSISGTVRTAMKNSASRFFALNEIEEIEEFIDSIPTGQERLEAAARRATADAIEAVLAAGLDAEFINPLKLMMEKLSENILEKHDD